ncbi:hypothetical protein [Thiofilum flexile]|uniref:hypothetical protein n=1 Tax=Thiofilum flexile TaxID=125627 RepID=UPI00036DE89A|nr:hypothetical protein [Thiofilum flexile]
MKELLENRSFQLWFYEVSHGQLLIRSPKKNDIPYNIDIIFSGVEYISLPIFLNEISIDEQVTDTEKHQVSSALGKRFEYNNKIYVLCSGQNRYLVCASHMKIKATDLDLFELPFDRVIKTGSP